VQKVSFSGEKRKESRGQLGGMKNVRKENRVPGGGKKNKRESFRKGGLLSVVVGKKGGGEKSLGGAKQKFGVKMKLRCPFWSSDYGICLTDEALDDQWKEGAASNWIQIVCPE